MSPSHHFRLWNTVYLLPNTMCQVIYQIHKKEETNETIQQSILSPSKPRTVSNWMYTARKEIYYHGFLMLCFIFSKCSYHAPSHGTFTQHHKPTWISTTCPIQLVTCFLHIFDALSLWQTSRDEAVIGKILTIMSFPAPKPHKIGRVVLKGEAVLSYTDISIEDTLSFSKYGLKAEGFLWPGLLTNASHQQSVKSNTEKTWKYLEWLSLGLSDTEKTPSLWCH